MPLQIGNAGVQYNNQPLLDSLPSQRAGSQFPGEGVRARMHTRQHLPKLTWSHGWAWHSMPIRGTSSGARDLHCPCCTSSLIRSQMAGSLCSALTGNCDALLRRRRWRRARH